MITSTAWVLVTGGAKRIGAFLNQEFAKSGKNIVLHYNQSETAALALKSQLETFNIKVVLWQADLNDPASIELRFADLLNQVAHIEILINNASIFEQTSLLESSLAQIQSNLNIHLTSPWLLIQALVRQNKPCQIINISDANLSHLYTSKSAYFISKKAQETLTELAAIECAPNVRVNAVAPGYVLEASVVNTKLSSQTSSQIDDKDINILQRKVPLADLYSAIEFLSNNHSITGQTLKIDGGSHLQCPPYMLKN
ncbi:SDR family NAD(P)-dependent oxidoreductase [Colwellia psychrerythraea]|uniref:Short-chain dehydrogenase/reductase SDR n=1 Tax=Colwellia psychrerythraea TaxID=28229 RepID=A0A099KT35_COLPS|nr:SDR family NAD(P)-dependent oxidoreductase [Colwellia psychrerythraea]KGJ93934.1 short-chain dehydrogenase/reductase SDR [Colwellia psychrerythraea]